jgi:glycosyltransferase involved in cell wall biosynthesis
MNQELSIVMPCLNEADTLEICIKKAQASIEKHQLQAEIIVADNGSTDGSIEIAERLGARVVPVEEKGYGSALMGGIAAANGTYIIMGDADDSYDFLDIFKFVEKLREGYDIVQGCRLPSGGGTVAPGAMPFLHRWWGNPMFTWMVRSWFKAPIHDVYCGLRGFRKDFYQKIDQQCTGMEFATEMIIKASIYNHKIAEVPITLHPDGRKSHPPHLKTFRDGWRTLRFFLMYSPRSLFLIPGVVMSLVGFIFYLIALPGFKFANIVFDVHTLVYGSLFILCGFQSIFFAIFTKTFAIQERMMPEDKRLHSFFTTITLERGLLIGLSAFVVGIIILIGAIRYWQSLQFGRLDYAVTMRWVIPGSTLTALGFQTILSSFFVSILGMKRKGSK